MTDDLNNDEPVPENPPENPSNNPQPAKAEPSDDKPQRHESRAAFVQLLFVLGAAFFASLITDVTRTLLVVLAIVLMVMIHELGHFATAKWSGMKVTQFFFGFGPRLWSIKRGETEYGIRAIPAGGFVQVIGMNNLEVVDPAEESRAFRSSPVWRRVVMASAGSFMHYVMAFLLSFSLLAFVGLPDAKGTEIGGIIELQSQSPAVAAGLQVGDRFVVVNGQPVNVWDDAVQQFLAARVGQPLPVTIDRDGQRLDLTIVPIDRREAVTTAGERFEADDPNSPTGFVGVQAQVTYVTQGPLTAAKNSVSNLVSGTTAVFGALAKMFSLSGLRTYVDNVTGNVPEAEQEAANETRFVSVVGLVNYADDAANSGWFAVLSLLFSINLFVGIFNMVPLLPFDGGHVAIAIYEKLRSFRRSPYHADYAKLVPVSYAVFFVLLLITTTSLWLDVTNPLPNQFK